ncbi:4Fe-4S dicluster domain-containing protein [Natronospora cellulosivora (SeqCode)]
MAKLKKLDINKKRCKGCMLCVRACPQKILKMSKDFNQKGYHPVELVDHDKCTSCGLCAMVCPDVVIKVFRKDD